MGLRPGNGNGKEGEEEELIRGVTACLSLYHVFPLYRAWKRICMSSSRAAVDGNEKKDLREVLREGGKKEGKEDETKKTLGGPVVHFVVHMIVGGLMGAAGLGLL